jgi:S1-C subfamily serine protease
MRSWAAPLGLLVGCIFCGLGLLRFGTGHTPPPAAIMVLTRAVPITTRLSPSLPSVSGPPGAVIRVGGTPSADFQSPASGMPQVVYPGSKGTATEADPHVVPVTLPNVIGPSPPPGSVVAGTGFFIADDGSLLTASHVVQDCRHIRIVSRSVRMTDVTRLADDRSVDVALLRAAGIRPPAVLALATTRPSSQRLFILGFPATASLRVPDETWGTLENARLPDSLGRLADARQTVWIQSGAVTHGYSGGPIFDPRDGTVSGLVKAGIEGSLLHMVHGMPTSGVSFGPGAAQLTAFVHREAPDLELAADSATDDDGLDIARRATVHVLCWRS